MIMLINILKNQLQLETTKKVGLLIQISRKLAIKRSPAKAINILFADIEHADQCELFDKENGLEKLDQLVDHEIEKHTKLATKIKENVAAWKKQREHYLRSKRLSQSDI